MPPALPRRLPGFRFETQADVRADILPRMDIAVFVGFAGAGPLDLPVLVESPAQFEMIFGPDLTLATTPGGEAVRAHLAPAVRDFFRHGGQRCWILRVAGSHATTTRFACPGVMRINGSALEPAFAQARSPGSGFDSTRIATSLMSRSLELGTPFDPADQAAAVIQDGRSLPVPGDTVRWTYRAEGYEALAVLTAVEQRVTSPPQRRDLLEICFDTLHWFAWPAARAPLNASGTIRFQRTPENIQEWPVSLVTAPETASPAGFAWPERLEDRNVELAARIPVSELPPVGALLRVDLGGDVLFLRLDSVAGADDQGSPPHSSARLSGEARWWLPSAPSTASTPTAERLSFECQARSGRSSPLRLTDLAFGSAHPRCWNELPPDSSLFQETSFGESLRAANATEREDLWRAAADPRFPVVGTGLPDSNFLPLLMRALPDQWIGPVTEEADGLVRDGLDRFGAALFLDPDLVEATSVQLAGAAEFIRFQSSTPRRLKGIHAAMGVEEATLIAVPDAVHPGWTRTTGEDPVSGTAPPNPEQAWGTFLRCALDVPRAPVLEQVTEPDVTGSFRLAWSHTDPGATAIELREGSMPDLTTATLLYQGTALDLTVYGRTPGNYYYVARSLAGDQPGEWSNVVCVRVSGSGRWQIREWDEGTVDQLAAVQRSVLRLCAARGDLFAVLALPDAWRTEDALEHLAVLRSARGDGIQVGGEDSPPLAKVCLPLGDAESAAWSYGAVYHSWVVRRDPEGMLWRTPPEGALTGLIAERSLRRGAWVAPANDPLRDVIALEPLLPREDWPSLQEAQINVLRQDAWGFRCLAADTLSSDVDVRPINVRRLLQLLRRVALRLGTTYVFEPMNDAFMRTVQHGFETLMLQLFARGAFAGRTPAESFQVNTGPSVNPPASRELGRFIVEIKVAPALPLRFLTLRLVQTGDRAEVSELQ